MEGFEEVEYIEEKNPIYHELSESNDNIFTYHQIAIENNHLPLYFFQFLEVFGIFVS